MRPKVLLIAVVAAVAAALAAPVHAGAPNRTTFVGTSLWCGDPLVGDDGTATLWYIDVNLVNGSTEFGADVAFWPDPADPSSDPPAVIGYSGTGSATADSLTAAIDLEDGAADPAGIAAVDVTFVADGPPVESSGRDRISQAWRTWVATDQPLLVATGTLEIGTASFDLAACTGNRHVETAFETQPDARIGRQIYTSLSCEFEAGGRTVSLFGFGGGGSMSLDVNIQPDGLTTYFEMPLVEAGDGFDLVGSGGLGDGFGSVDVDLHLSPDGDPVKRVLPRRTGWERSEYQRYSLAGSVRIPGLGVELTDFSGCGVLWEDYSGMISSQNGPSGPRPSNDAPDGAWSVDRGDEVRQRTSGASDGEAGTDCVGGEFTFARTVWYRVTGDGSPMTIDTAGSDFDTVVAVYVEEDLGEGPVLTEVACADDVFLASGFGREITAAVEFETEPGTDYWVQVGGWHNEWGRLVVTFD